MSSLHRVLNCLSFLHLFQIKSPKFFAASQPTGHGYAEESDRREGRQGMRGGGGAAQERSCEVTKDGTATMNADSSARTSLKLCIRHDWMFVYWWCYTSDVCNNSTVASWEDQRNRRWKRSHRAMKNTRQRLLFKCSASRHSTTLYVSLINHYTKYAVSK